MVPHLQGRLLVCCLVSPCITLPTPCLCCFVQNGLRPNSRIMYRFFTSHLPMMNEQDQLACEQKKSLSLLLRPSLSSARPCLFSVLQWWKICVKAQHLPFVCSLCLTCSRLFAALSSFFACFPVRRDLCHLSRFLGFLYSTLPRCPLC